MGNQNQEKKLATKLKKNMYKLTSKEGLPNRVGPEFLQNGSSGWGLSPVLHKLGVQFHLYNPSL